MKKSIYLSILLFLGLGFSSCQDQGQEINVTDLSIAAEVTDPDLYEQKLEQLSLYMGEVFKDREALRELFELAKADEHKEDISFSLKSLFDTKENPVSRKRSAIVNAFYQNAANHRISNEDLDLQELIDFINKYDITMLAPYMVGYFHPDSISELTVSWWTEEMEEEGLAKDPNWVGETPGYLLKLDEEGNFIRFRTNGANYFTSGKVLAGDDYAMSHPTVVFGDFYQGVPPTKGFFEAASVLNSQVNSLQSPICSELDDNNQMDVITVRLPEIQLEENIRRWPNPNYIYMWVATGSFDLGANGLPKLTETVNHPIRELKITRNEGNNKTWVDSKS
jgi:hypothetical protein